MNRSYLQYSNFSTYTEKTESFKSKFNKKAQILLQNKIFIPVIELTFITTMFLISLSVVVLR